MKKKGAQFEGFVTSERTTKDNMVDVLTRIPTCTSGGHCNVRR